MTNTIGAWQLGELVMTNSIDLIFGHNYHDQYWSWRINYAMYINSKCSKFTLVSTRAVSRIVNLLIGSGGREYIPLCTFRCSAIECTLIHYLLKDDHELLCIRIIPALGWFSEHITVVRYGVCSKNHENGHGIRVKLKEPTCTHPWEF